MVLDEWRTKVQKIRPWFNVCNAWDMQGKGQLPNAKQRRNFFRRRWQKALDIIFHILLIDIEDTNNFWNSTGNYIPYIRAVQISLGYNDASAKRSHAHSFGNWNSSITISFWTHNALRFRHIVIWGLAEVDVICQITINLSDAIEFHIGVPRKPPLCSKSRLELSSEDKS